VSLSVLVCSTASVRSNFFPLLYLAMASVTLPLMTLTSLPALFIKLTVAETRPSWLSGPQPERRLHNANAPQNASKRFMNELLARTYVNTDSIANAAGQGDT